MPLLPPDEDPEIKKLKEQDKGQKELLNALREEIAEKEKIYKISDASRKKIEIEKNEKRILELKDKIQKSLNQLSDGDNAPKTPSQAEKEVSAEDPRGGLLAQIRKGAVLKKAPDTTSTKPAVQKSTGAMGDVMASLNERLRQKKSSNSIGKPLVKPDAAPLLTVEKQKQIINDRLSQQQSTINERISKLKELNTLVLSKEVLAAYEKRINQQKEFIDKLEQKERELSDLMSQQKEAERIRNEAHALTASAVPLEIPRAPELEDVPEAPDAPTAPTAPDAPTAPAAPTPPEASAKPTPTVTKKSQTSEKKVSAESEATATPSNASDTIATPKSNASVSNKPAGFKDALAARLKSQKAGTGVTLEYDSNIIDLIIRRGKGKDSEIYASIEERLNLKGKNEELENVIIQEVQKIRDERKTDNQKFLSAQMKARRGQVENDKEEIEPTSTELGMPRVINVIKKFYNMLEPVVKVELNDIYRQQKEKEKAAIALEAATRERSRLEAEQKIAQKKLETRTEKLLVIQNAINPDASKIQSQEMESTRKLMADRTDFLQQAERALSNISPKMSMALKSAEELYQVAERDVKAAQVSREAAKAEALSRINVEQKPLTPTPAPVPSLQNPSESIQKASVETPISPTQRPISIEPEPTTTVSPTPFKPPIPLTIQEEETPDIVVTPEPETRQKIKTARIRPFYPQPAREAHSNKQAELYKDHMISKPVVSGQIEPRSNPEKTTKVAEFSKKNQIGGSSPVLLSDDQKFALKKLAESLEKHYIPNRKSTMNKLRSFFGGADRTKKVQLAEVIIKEINRSLSNSKADASIKGYLQHVISLDYQLNGSSLFSHKQGELSSAVLDTMEIFQPGFKLSKDNPWHQKSIPSKNL
jgi:hypothetical protein